MHAGCVEACTAETGIGLRRTEQPGRGDSPGFLGREKGVPLDLADAPAQAFDEEVAGGRVVQDRPSRLGGEVCREDGIERRPVLASSGGRGRAALLRAALLRKESSLQKRTWTRRLDLRL
jgi:hypothetical protein